MMLIFLAGIIMLIVKIQMEASFYISNSGSRDLGYVYDCNGDIILTTKLKREIIRTVISKTSAIS